MFCKPPVDLRAGRRTERFYRRSLRCRGNGWMLGVLPNFPFVSPAAEWNARSQQAERFRFQGPRLLASRAHTTSPRGGGGGPERPCVSTGFLLLCAPAPVELRRQKGDELAERFLKLGL